MERADPNGNGPSSFYSCLSCEKEEASVLIRSQPQKTFAHDHTEDDDDFVQSSEFRKFVLFLFVAVQGLSSEERRS